METIRLLLDRQTCLFYRWTHLYCPGCGGTRAVFALLGGHPLLSFLYHPIPFYLCGMGLVGVFLFLRTICFRKKSITAERFFCIVLLGAAVTLLLNYDVRLLLTLLFAMDPMPS